MFLESRRFFFKNTFLSTAVLIMPNGKLFGAVTPSNTIALVQEDLFPTSPKLYNNASRYISLILNHSHVSDEDKQFIRNGVQWLNEESVELYKKTYTNLTSTQRQNTLQTISEYRWGQSWIENMLTYIMEATLGDPLYGINKNKTGWKWLNHASGLPRPKEALL